MSYAERVEIIVSAFDAPGIRAYLMAIERLASRVGGIDAAMISRYHAALHALGIVEAREGL